MTIIDEYLELYKKKENEFGKDVCLLMQVGHFYEVYAVDNDIEKINDVNIRKLSSIMNTQLTKKNKNITENNRHNPLMIGINKLSVDKYIHILTNNNYTIVIVDQVTLPPNPERKIVNTISPGTNVNYVTNSDSNNLLIIYIEDDISKKKPMKLGLCLLDLSIGKSIVYETYSTKDDNTISLDDAYRFIQIHTPKEIVIYTNSNNIDKRDLYRYLEIDSYIVHYNDKTNNKYTSITGQKEILSMVYKNTGMLSPIEYIDLEFKQYALISFVIAIDFAYRHNEYIINRIERPEIWDEDKYLSITNSSVNQLNLLSNNNNNTIYNSLFGVVNNTSTSFGKRFLRNILLNPILNIDTLNNRYNTVEKLLPHYNRFEDILNKISDIERLHRKISLKIINPCDFCTLDISYKSIQKIILLCREIKVDNIVPGIDILKSFSNYIEFYSKTFNMNEMCKFHINKITTSIFNKGIYPDIDNLQSQIDQAHKRIKFIVDKLSFLIAGIHDCGCVKYEYSISEGHHLYLTDKRSKILEKNLKRNDEFGNYAHIGVQNTVPTHLGFATGSILKNIKFIKSKNKSHTKIKCKELSDISKLIIENTELVSGLVKMRFIEILETIDTKFIDTLVPITHFISQIDMYKSNAKTAKLYGYTRPCIKQQPNSFINAVDIRHPIIERIQIETDYITNNISIGEENKGILLFGTNASGKSSLMKAIGINIIMAQAGMFVPCSKFTFAPYKQLFTRINNNDNIFKGLSSFAVEMSELRSILKRSDKNSIVLGDELCSGTESVSALSIFASSVHKMISNKSSFIFATHLHELCNLNIIKNLMGQIKMYHLKVTYDESTSTLIYDRKLTDGSGDAIYGLEVCKGMDMDRDFITMAHSIRNIIMNKQDTLLKDKVSKYNNKIYVNKCKICDTDATEVHHIKFQSEANNNLINHVHVHNKSNLVPLCHTCHDKVHNKNLEIYGYIQTSNGVELKFDYINTDELHAKKKSRKKFNDDDILKIRNFINSCGILSSTIIKHKLHEEHNITISVPILNKIKNNLY